MNFLGDGDGDGDGDGGDVGGEVDFDQTHGLIMAIAWFGLTHIALWSTVFKQYRISLYIHIAIGLMIALLGSVGSMLILSHEGFDYELDERGLHNGVGAFLFYFTPVLALSGALAKVTKTEPIKPFMAKVGAYQHRVVGWICIILSRMPLYTGFTPISDFPTLFFIIFDGVSVLLFWIWRFLPSSVYKTVQQAPGDAREVTTEKSLGVYGMNYFIFDNSVYSIERLLTTHPGGFTLIDKVRGREVDRFIYGGEFLEEHSSDAAHEHSTQSLKLAEDLLARINIPAVHRQMAPLNMVELEEIGKLHESVSVHLLYLASKGTPFEFEGHTRIEQIGRCYSLTAGSTTRLYSAVHFANKTNLQLMSKIFGIEFKLIEKEADDSSRGIMGEQMIATSETKIRAKDRQFLPLMIKKYEKGKFTSKHLSMSQKSYELSHPHGFGLSLDSYAPGKIVMFSGGTGFYPFSDLIDLLYKSMLVEEGSSFAKELINNDPILDSRPFKHHTFEIYCSLKNVCEIHPVSLAQMNKLSEKGRLKCVIRGDVSHFKGFREQFGQIELRRERFNDLVAQLSRKQEGFSQILLCGPGAMTNQLVQVLKNENVSSNKYKII